MFHSSTGMTVQNIACKSASQVVPSHAEKYISLVNVIFQIIFVLEDSKADIWL